MRRGSQARWSAGVLAIALWGTLLGSLPASARAQEEAAGAAEAAVRHELSFDVEAREWTVRGVYPVPAQETIDLHFPRWTAGAYHLAEYGRWVLELDAYGPQGRPLPVERRSDGHFVISTGGASPLRVQWRAGSMSSSGMSITEVLDVEANRIRDDYAYLNPASLFAFVPELVDAPIELSIDAPAGWKTATVMAQDEEGRYRADSFWRLEDSPLLFSPTLRTARFEAHGRPHLVTVHGRGEAELQRITQGCEAIVDAAYEVMGRLPYERYHFLLGFVPEGQASGLEHEDSTLILLSEQLPRGAFGDETLWSLLSHEYFHLWVAERIKVESLVRPDYTQPVDTTTLWVNEGINEYFSQHILLRAGLKDEEAFFRAFSNNLALMPRLEPLLRQRSWTELSAKMSTWTQDPTDIQLFLLRCYQIGPVIVLALDCEMRRASGGEKGIADLLLLLDERYVQKGIGFPEGAMIECINEVAGADLRPFYDRFIAGAELPDVEEALAVLGYRVRGGLRTVQSLPSPSEEQRAAREDFFALPERRQQPVVQPAMETVIATEKGEAEGPRLLAVVAHPDDDVSFAGVMYKTAVLRGGHADIVVITNGEGGFKYSTLAEHHYGLELTDEAVGRAELPRIRKEEMTEGARAMRVHRLFFLGQQDHRYTQDVSEVLGAEAEVWDLDFVRRSLDQVLEEGDYDFVLTLIAHPTTHGHHQAATLLALEAVAALPEDRRPVILSGRAIPKAEAGRGVVGLPDHPSTRARNADAPYVFDRTEPFGHKDRLNATIIAHWAIAAHKSQGTMQMLVGRGEIEEYYLSTVNAPDAEERAARFFESLRGNPFPVKEYGPSAGVPRRDD